MSSTKWNKRVNFYFDFIATPKKYFLIENIAFVWITVTYCLWPEFQSLFSKGMKNEMNTRNKIMRLYSSFEVLDSVFVCIYI